MSNPIWAVNDNNELLEKEIEKLLNNLCTDDEAEYLLSLI